MFLPRDCLYPDPRGHSNDHYSKLSTGWRTSITSGAFVDKVCPHHHFKGHAFNWQFTYTLSHLKENLTSVTSVEGEAREKKISKTNSPSAVGKPVTTTRITFSVLINFCDAGEYCFFLLMRMQYFKQLNL